MLGKYWPLRAKDLCSGRKRPPFDFETITFRLVDEERGRMVRKVGAKTGKKPVRGKRKAVTPPAKKNGGKSKSGANGTAAPKPNKRPRKETQPPAGAKKTQRITADAAEKAVSAVKSELERIGLIDIELRKLMTERGHLLDKKGLLYTTDKWEG